MQWNEVDLLVSPMATDLVALLVYECGSNGSVIDDQEPDVEGRIRITAYFPLTQEGLVETVREKMNALESRGADLGHWQVIEKNVNDEDWLFAWQEHFHPKKISRRFWAEPAWEKVSSGPDEDVLTIDPGLAFGSGFHDTTCLCVQYLEDTVQPGDVVFDIGTGTGILAIAAAKLGAAHVAAVDFDSAAVAQARVNAALNGVEDRMSIANSDLLTAIPKGQQADVIVANLVTNAVLDLLPAVGPYLKDGGTLIVSGIIDDRIDDVRRAAETAGFNWADEQLRSGWYAVKLTR
ncbi:50S ribosomal protein L11 methyltransferase [Megasphaera sp.]|uniref:50S ribosomal protein L11 methyltransferase n=1 Tax=Megasphaera sp. TaxID=2023260 RepID=UPI00258AB4F7|nr:50S ribosomal protein L11 methyltransferase [Megasphaera sp.]